MLVGSVVVVAPGAPAKEDVDMLACNTAVVATQPSSREVLRNLGGIDNQLQVMLTIATRNISGTIRVGDTCSSYKCCLGDTCCPSDTCCPGDTLCCPCYTYCLE